MTSTRCPGALEELIEAVNSGKQPVAGETLRAIAQTFFVKRRGQDKGATQLAVALSDVMPASQLGRIRECPICKKMFWASRADKETCTQHAGTWRKREQRRKDAERRKRLAHQRPKRIKRQAQKEIVLSLTTATILDALDDRCRTFTSIDDYCYLHLRATSKYTGMYSKPNVRRGLQYLVNLGYLNDFKREDGEMHYTATAKVEELRRKLYPKEPIYSFRYFVNHAGPDQSLS